MGREWSRLDFQEVVDQKGCFPGRRYGRIFPRTWPVAIGAEHAIFYVPSVGQGEMLGVLVVPKGRFLGIRIVPSMHGDSVKIAVTAMLKDKKKLSDATCDDIRSWPSVDAGSYEGGKGASFPLSTYRKNKNPFQMDRWAPPALAGWSHLAVSPTDGKMLVFEEN